MKSGPLSLTLKGWACFALLALGCGGNAEDAPNLAMVGDLSDVHAISANVFEACALRADRTVWCWGRHEPGLPEAIEGIYTASAVGVGHDHACAIQLGGTVWCWGPNSYGQLGNGTQTNDRGLVEVQGLSDAIAIGTGSAHSCALIDDGSVWCWGNAFFGQLGNGVPTETDDGRAIAVNEDGSLVDAVTDEYISVLDVNIPIPVQVQGLSNVTSLSVGENHNCAIDESDALWCWGRNDSGQIGDGTTDKRRTPVEVSDLSGVRQVSAGDSHTCAVDDRGTLFCWGYNGAGGLGFDTDYQDFVRPGQVRSLSDMIAVDAGWQHTCAIKGDGTVWCWGLNDAGQLGYPATEELWRSSTPTAVEGVSNITALALGYAYSCALRDDGTVWCWGFEYLPRD